MNFKLKREQAGFKQKVLAEKLNISRSALCQYEKGKRKVPVHILKKMAEIFCCSVDDLLSD